MSKILLIDDEESNVRVLARSLCSDGHEVVCALSGEQGLEMFAQQRPELVLTDIKMPGINGIEVLRSIRARQPDTEVIIITGHGDIDNAIEALKFGASDFIHKPIRDDVLAVAIQRAEEKRAIKYQLREYTENLEQKVKQATEEVRRKSHFLSKLIRSANDGIIATDKALTVVIFNPGAERVFGYTFREVMYCLKITDLLNSQIGEIFSAWSSGNVIGGELARIETTIVSKDRVAIPVSFYAATLQEKNEMVGTVSFFQDLREIKRLEAELLHAERLAAIGQTIAGVAHGVKNVLHGFKGGSYLVNLGIAKGDNDKLQKGWDMIQRNIERTSDLVMDLLTYSKDRDPEYTCCDPNTIITDVCEMMQGLAAENQIELKTDLDPTIKSVIMDPHTIHQCLSNLISNAIDACLFDQDMTKKWQVTVKSLCENGRNICIQICDNGIGMDETVQEKLFRSFFSTKGHRGTGLGLLVTRKAVVEHGGSIDVQSEAGKGTVFTLYLPFQRRVLQDNHMTS